MHSSWSLIQVDLSQEDVDDDLPMRNYSCTFFQHHQQDNDRPDNIVIWWSEGKELILNTNGDYDFGEHILFTSRQNLALELYKNVSSTIDLSSTSTILADQFNFKPRTNTTSMISYILDIEWATLVNAYRDLSIITPTLSASTRQMIACATVYWRFLTKHNVL